MTRLRRFCCPLSVTQIHGSGRASKSFLRTENYYPAILYKDADAVIRDRLIAQVETDQVNRNHLLLALAWIGDEEVVRLFAAWRQSPPVWTSALYISPEMYAREAGWELDADGGKRLLIHPECYPFKVYKEEIAEAPRTPAAVTALQTGAASCPWCGGELTVLFDYDLQHPLLQFMKLPGKRLRIAACMHCNCYGTVFMNVDLEGGYSWSPYNTVPEYLPDNNGGQASPVWHVMQLSEQPAGTYESAHWTLEAPASQIGGTSSLDSGYGLSGMSLLLADDDLYRTDGYGAGGRQRGNLLCFSMRGLPDYSGELPAELSRFCHR
ncbi:hypothetical protein ACFSQ7_40370 [Paenibacillus rhizoplanae]